MVRIMSMLKARLDFLDDLIEEAYMVYNSEVSWERKYRLVFSEAVSGQITKALSSLNLVLVWCDPDTSYQDDVTAYIDALEELERDIGKLYEDVSISYIIDAYIDHNNFS